MSEEKCFFVLRIRGEVGMREELEDVFKFLHITRKNHATIIKGTPSNLGMIQKIKDYATWGEASLETISIVLRGRGLVIGNKKLTDDYVKENLEYDSIDGLAKAIYELKVNFWKLDNVKPVLRLHPPRGGFRRQVRRSFPGGELGYRGEAMNQLLKKMI
ncbi:MAG: large subunit ribosomal protein [Thermoproteota archaeon]|nr:large subunit ribosomal protein [Thermoproteota archaeon]